MSLSPSVRPPEAEDGALIFETHPDEQVPYTVRCEPPPRVSAGEVADWSFNQLNEEPFKERLGHHLAALGLRTVYAPTVSHLSGLILPPRSFTQRIPLPGDVTVLRPLDPCDAVSLEPQDGFAMSAAGCPLVVLSGPTMGGSSVCLAAHAGRDSLIDRRFVHQGGRSRRSFSVVDALVAYALTLGAPPSQLILRSFFSIPWEAFPHAIDDPVYGVKNGQLFVYLGGHNSDRGIFPRHEGKHHLSLSALIRNQAIRAGIKRTQEIGLLGLPRDGAFAYTTHSNPLLSGKVRNLVTVLRH